MISRQQRTPLLLVALILGATCQPTPPEQRTSTPSDNQESVEVATNSVERSSNLGVVEPRWPVTSREHHEYKYHKGIIVKQLLPVLFAAFMNAVTSVMFNWFFPWKVIPPIPGRLGIGQLFGGFLPKHQPYFPPPPPLRGFK